MFRTLKEALHHQQLGFIRQSNLAMQWLVSTHGVPNRAQPFTHCIAVLLRLSVLRRGLCAADCVHHEAPLPHPLAGHDGDVEQRAHQVLAGVPQADVHRLVGSGDIPSSNTWDELEGEDWKAKLAALNTEDWLAKFKRFLLKTSTCRWDTQPDAGDIDSWLRWYAASALHRTGHSLPLRGAGVPS